MPDQHQFPPAITRPVPPDMPDGQWLIGLDNGLLPLRHAISRQALLQAYEYPECRDPITGAAECDRRSVRAISAWGEFRRGNPLFDRRAADTCATCLWTVAVAGDRVAGGAGTAPHGPAGAGRCPGRPAGGRGAGTDPGRGPGRQPDPRTGRRGVAGR